MLRTFLAFALGLAIAPSVEAGPVPRFIPSVAAPAPAPRPSHATVHVPNVRVTPPVIVIEQIEAIEALLKLKKPAPPMPR